MEDMQLTMLKNNAILIICNFYLHNILFLKKYHYILLLFVIIINKTYLSMFIGGGGPNQ